MKRQSGEMPASQIDISATIDGRNGEQGILLSRS
jgi:hypothetical protein